MKHSRASGVSCQENKEHIISVRVKNIIYVLSKCQRTVMEPVLRGHFELLCGLGMQCKNSFMPPPPAGKCLAPWWEGAWGGRGWLLPVAELRTWKEFSETSNWRAGRAHRCQRPGFVDEGLDVQRNEVTCPRTHHWSVTEINLRSRMAALESSPVFFSPTASRKKGHFSPGI